MDVMSRFSLRSAVSRYVDDAMGVLVEALLAGPDGLYRLELRVMHGVELVFQSHRGIRFRDGSAAISIMPAVDVPRGYCGSLHLAVDGECLPPIAF